MKYLTFAALAIVVASPALSQSLPGFEYVGSTVTLSYNLHDNASDEPFAENHTLSLIGTAEFNIGSNFGLDVSLGRNEEVFLDSFFTGQTFVDLNPYYRVEGGEIGVFYTALSEDDGSGSVSQNHFGIIGSQSYNGFTFEGYVGRLDEESFESDTLGLAIGYDVLDDLEIYYSNRRDLNADDSSDYFGLASIGARYDLSGITNGQPVTVGAEYSRFYTDSASISDFDWTQFSLIATYSFGGSDRSYFNGIRSVDTFFD